MSEAVLTLPKLLKEKEAYDAFGHLLEDKELRQARADGKIGYYRFKNAIHYREDELRRYLAKRLEGDYTPPCQKPSSPSAATALCEFQAPPTSTDHGMTPELEKSAAALLRRQTSKPPRSRSRPSSSRKETGGRASQRT